jgi:hypothetical protein
MPRSSITHLSLFTQTDVVTIGHRIYAGGNAYAISPRNGLVTLDTSCVACPPYSLACIGGGKHVLMNGEMVLCSFSIPASATVTAAVASPTHVFLILDWRVVYSVTRSTGQTTVLHRPLPYLYKLCRLFLVNDMLIGLRRHGDTQSDVFALSPATGECEVMSVNVEGIVDMDVKGQTLFVWSTWGGLFHMDVSASAPDGTRLVAPQRIEVDERFSKGKGVSFVQTTWSLLSPLLAMISGKLFFKEDVANLVIPTAIGMLGQILLIV